MVDFAVIFEEAMAAGRAAVAKLDVVPMVVGSAKGIMSNEIDYSKPSYFVADGVCGFAWVRVKGNSPFGRWAKKQGLARPGYPSGLDISIREYNQSMQKKEAHAYAMAAVLQKYGIDAYANSRMD